MKILIVDDEAEIRRVLRLLLETQNNEIAEAPNGKGAIRLMKEDPTFDLIIMDVMMPVLSGIDAVREIRTFSDVPVLFLSAKSMDNDKKNAYEAGGDDYLVKPFSSKELMMKVDALTRRYNLYKAKGTTLEDGAVRLAGDVILNPQKREVTKSGTPIDVRDKEMDVLIYLVKNRGRAVNPEELYRDVWEEIPLPSSGNTVTVHILNLRRKLEDTPSSPKIIRTIWGKGYQID